MESSLPRKVKIALIGATGATGKEIIRFSQACENIEELALVCRRRLEEWKDEDFKFKLKVIQIDNFDDLSVLKADLQGYDAFLCTLGSLTKHGKETLIKVEKTYPIEFGRIGVELGVKYYGLLSSTGVSETSWMWQVRNKAECEKGLRELGFKYTTFNRPGFLLNRDNDKRLIETIASKIPFIPKVQDKDLALTMLHHAINTCQNDFKQANDDGEKKVIIITNEQLKEYAANVKQQLGLDAKK